MTTVEMFLLISMLINFAMIVLVAIVLMMYLHSRQWRDEWRDAHVDALNEWGKWFKSSRVERSAPPGRDEQSKTTQRTPAQGAGADWRG